jgi:S-formylglutathione hydrolase
MYARPVLAFLAAASMLAAHSTHAAAKNDTARLQRVVVHAESLVGNLAGDSPDRQVSVYLPPSYAKQAQRRYPVLYLLHGFTDSDANWFGLEGKKHFVNVPTAVDAAYANGVTEMIVVMPNAFNRYQGSFYSSSVVIGDWETFITRELVRYVDSHYRTLTRPESRGLAGHSMGGYGTLRLGMKVPGVFSVLYAMSPCCLAPNLQPDPQMFAAAAKVHSTEEIAAADFMTKAMLAAAAAWAPNPKNPPLYLNLPVVDGKVFPDVLAAGVANAPIAMLHQYIPALKSYRALGIDAGDQDMPIADTVATLHILLDEYSIAHTYEIYPGDHLNRIDNRLTTKVLPFFGERLKQAK